MLFAGHDRTRLRQGPERGVIHSVLLAQLEAFVARSREHGGGLPRFVEREFYRYLQCSVLAFGFARMHCSGCGRDDRVTGPLRNSPSRLLRFAALRRTGAYLSDGVVVREILDPLGLTSGPPITTRSRVAEERTLGA